MSLNRAQNGFQLFTVSVGEQPPRPEERSPRESRRAPAPLGGSLGRVGISLAFPQSQGRRADFQPRRDRASSNCHSTLPASLPCPCKSISPLSPPAARWRSLARAIWRAGGFRRWAKVKARRSRFLPLSRLRGRVPSKARRVGALSADSQAERTPTPALPRKRGRGRRARLLLCETIVHNRIVV
jgi:hypothetical protein